MHKGAYGIGGSSHEAFSWGDKCGLGRQRPSEKYPYPGRAVQETTGNCRTDTDYGNRAGCFFGGLAVIKGRTGIYITERENGKRHLCEEVPGGKTGCGADGVFSAVGWYFCGNDAELE